MTVALFDQPTPVEEAEALHEAQERQELAKLLRDLLADYDKEKERLAKIDRWYRWDPEAPTFPRGTTKELKALWEMARNPWLGLVVTSTAQAMFVDGWHSGVDEQLEPVEAADGEPTRVVKPKTPSRQWRIWQANDMDHKQTMIHRAMLAYGYAFATCLAGTRGHDDPEDVERVAVIKGYSPRRMQAWYDDPANDEWPRHAIEMISESETGRRLRLFDDSTIRTIRVSNTKIDVNALPEVTVEETSYHGAGVTPVVRYTNQLDLDGRTPGEVEPHIPIAAKINKTAYDRLLVQHFNSWKVRTVTGMSPADTDEENNRKRLRLRIEDLLIAEDPDTKFGTLDGSELGGFIAAHEADVEALAAVTQTPTHELTGKLINVSAEGLAMIRASQQQKVFERQTSATKSHNQLLRLGCHIEGDRKAAGDFQGKVTWQDTSIRSMAQAVDALGKACQMLQIPAQALWGRIPGVDKTDVEDWVRIAAALDPVERLRKEMEAQDEREAAEEAAEARRPVGGGTDNGSGGSTTSTSTGARGRPPRDAAR